MTEPHPDVAKYDRAVVEHEAREFADSIGYGFHTMTDGTIILEPPTDPDHEARVARSIDALFPDADAERYPHGSHCHDCGVKLTALDRHQRVINNPGGGTNGPAFTLEFVCNEHYRNPK